MPYVETRVTFPIRTIEKNKVLLIKFEVSCRLRHLHHGACMLSSMLCISQFCLVTNVQTFHLVFITNSKSRVNNENEKFCTNQFDEENNHFYFFKQDGITKFFGSVGSSSIRKAIF